MGFTLLRKAVTLAPLFATIVLFSACSEELPEQSEEAEIKSINIFFSKEDEAGASVGKAYSYSPDTGLVTEIATINDTPDSIAVLDTDEEAPGYEFAAFAEGRKLKLIDYSKTATKRIYELETYSADICGVYPVKRPADTVFDSDSNYYLKPIDDFGLYVALKTTDQCSRNTDSYRLLKFDLDFRSPVRLSRSATSSEVFGAYLFDRSYKNGNGQENGRSIWVSHNRDTESLSARTSTGELLFDIPFKYKAENRPLAAELTPPPFIIQLDPTNLLVQQALVQYDLAGNIIEDTVKLYQMSVTTLLSLLDGSGDVQTEDIFSLFFTYPLTQVQLVNNKLPITFELMDKFAAFEDLNGVYRYNLNSSSVDKIYHKEPNLLDISIAATNSGDIVLKKVFPEHQSLKIIRNNSDGSEIQVITSAKSIELAVSKGTLYINALDASDVLGEQGISSGWLLAELLPTKIIRLVEGALFSFSENPFDKDELIILTSSSDPTDTELITPFVSKYDSSELEGIFTFREYEDEGLVPSTEEAATFGQISSNVSQTYNDIGGANFSVNRSFSALQVKGSNENLGFFYSSDQTDDIETNRTETLSLIRRTPISEVIAINFNQLNASKSAVARDL